MLHSYIMPYFVRIMIFRLITFCPCC